MQREDLMFSQYIVWYEKKDARTMVEIMYNIKLILDNTYYIFEFICQNFSKTLSNRPDKTLDEFMISSQIWTPEHQHFVSTDYLVLIIMVLYHPTKPKP